jgi:ketosteroid isomerase-like protein
VEPIEVVRAFDAAWATHDLDAALALMTEDGVFESTGPAPDGIRHVGRDQLRRAWQPVFDDMSAMFEVEELVVADHRVLQRWRYSWAGGHVRGVDIFTVRDGLVTEKLSYVKG